MPVVRVIDREGLERQLEARSGQKVMEVLREDGGVPALCGGMCSCGTCHVYIHPEWLGRLPAAMSNERELLSSLEHAKAESRLSCQLEITEAMNGLRVALAPEE